LSPSLIFRLNRALGFGVQNAKFLGKLLIDKLIPCFLDLLVVNPRKYLASAA
jgi:hypothetical protein